uniref:IRF tryptophan pentad repeat domain-containing protein n=1 Tax=Laticauda laticaudata TaxID=8630 RepID=A0A8C5RIE3_LATLA
MATSKRGMRSTRKLRDWTVEQVESGKFQGLVWDDPPAKTMFRIPWKHAGKQEFRQEEDAGFFKAWAIYKGKYNPGEYNPATWKTRVRCALSKSPEFEEVPSRSRLDISEPYKVYRLVPVLEQVLGNKVKKQNTKQVKMDDSGSPGAASPQKKSQPPANSLLLLESAETPAPEVMASHLSNCFNLPNCQSREVSPQATEPALELYQEGLGPLPDPRVILYVGDELDGNEHMGCKSIIIQMEQTFAIRMCSSCCSQ